MGKPVADHSVLEPLVIVGQVCGVSGVRGQVKVRSYTRPPENILGFNPWFLCRDGERSERAQRGGRCNGGRVVAGFEGVDDRDAAQALVGRDIGIPRDRLPELPPGEFYWHELIGLRVRNAAGTDLGRVGAMQETGSNDVLVVEGGRRMLIPYLPGRVVKQVDLAAGILTVEWTGEFL
jgi:16S rRNA processing protein RimM